LKATKTVLTTRAIRSIDALGVVSLLSGDKNLELPQIPPIYAEESKPVRKSA